MTNIKMKHVHLMGIGGIGVSAVAQLLLQRSAKVSGCDVKLNSITEKLKKMGADITIGHSPAHINNSIDALVYTSAVCENHLELAEARKNSIPILRRAQMLAEIVKDRSVIAVTGTHGKTTTSFMIAHIMECAGLNSGFAIGGEMRELGGNARWSDGKYFVLEADESDGTQIYIKPEIAVITNIDCDHMEHYSNISDISRVMCEFTNKVPESGLVIGCGEDAEVKEILKNTKAETISHGFGMKNDVYALDIDLGAESSKFSVWYKGKNMGRVNLNIPGRHNILNALAGISVCLRVGVPFEKISAALSIYPGVKRRLDIVFQNDEIKIMDDYAHHPREIKAVVDTVSKMKQGRCIGIFQPHRYTRTKLLAREFGYCFEGLDKLILTDIYPAGESPIKGVSGRLIYDEVLKFGKPEAIYIESKDDILDYLVSQLVSGDTVVFMGAGDITELAHMMSNKVLNVV